MNCPESRRRSDGKVLSCQRERLHAGPHRFRDESEPYPIVVHGPLVCTCDVSDSDNWLGECRTCHRKDATKLRLP